MKKFFAVICTVLFLNIGFATAEEPDPGQWWGTLAFGPNQIEMEGLVPDLLIVKLIGQNAGWTVKRTNDGKHRVSFLSVNPIPNLILTDDEYELFKTIHITIDDLKDEFILIPTAQQTSQQYDAILLNIDDFSSLQLKVGVGSHVGFYSLQATRDGIEIPLVYIDQARYDQLLYDMDRIGPLLRFDELGLPSEE